MSDTVELEPTIEGMSFDEWVAFLSQFTTDQTAREIAAIEFGLGGDSIELPGPPPTEPDDVS